MCDGKVNSLLFNPKILLSTWGLLLILNCSSVPVPDVSQGALWTTEMDREQVDLSGTLKTLDGQDVTLMDLQEDKVMFLNLWATWCGPCREEMPSMASLYHKFSDKDFTMVAVSDEDTPSVREFLQEQPYPFTILTDPENILGDRFEVYAIPTTLIVDSQGRLALRHTGAQKWDSPEIIDQIDQLVSQQ